MGSVELVLCTSSATRIVVLSMNDVSTFGAVEDIVALQTDVYYLVCSLLVFSHHFHAFIFVNYLVHNIYMWCVTHTF